MNTSDIEQYCFVAGNHDLSVWKHQNCSATLTVETKDFYQCIQLDYIQLYNVHLNAYKTKNRKIEFEKLEEVAKTSDKSYIFVGDFNLAPRLQDGIYDKQASRFNNGVDRGAYNTFISALHLDDILQTLPPEYTIERQLMGKMSQFRCDFLLISHYLSEDVSAHYDHDTRKKYRFTDHSAIVFDVNYSLDDVVNSLESSQQYCPEKTAMNRRNASPIAKVFCDFLKEIQVPRVSILDYGCGYGKDVDYYAQYFDLADGYDPNIKFERQSLSRKKYQNIALTYVLNVIETPNKRLEIIEKIADLLETDGYCIIAVRSKIEIDSFARKKKWIPHMDGYWSSVSRKTFQKGFTLQYLKSLLETVNNLEIVDAKQRGQNTVYVICKRIN